MTKQISKKPQENYNISKNNWELILLLICWALPLAWVASYPYKGNNEDQNVKLKTHLNTSKTLIKNFYNEYEAVPQNLNELRAYARAKKEDFVPWDTYGQRLNYLRLSPDSWYLKSFGSDGQQNTLMTDEDFVVSSIDEESSQGIVHDYNQNAILYNPVILLGSNSPQGNWFAKLYLDKTSSTRRLLVRHRAKNNYFMIAEHDTVEEFYWLPDGYRIIFSATGSSLYRDGIYLWNLINNKLTNIYPGKYAIDSMNRGIRQKQIAISLAGIMKKPLTVFAFSTEKNAGPIKTTEFFSEHNFIAISLKEDGKTIVNKFENSKSWYKMPLVNSWTPTSDILQCTSMHLHQVSWCQLPTEGAFQDVIEAWQNYAVEQSSNPIFPYTLMRLVILYSDSYDLLSHKLKSNPNNLELKRNKEILRSYGAEIAAALKDLPTAASWLKATAWYSLEQFYAKKSLPFKASKVIIQEASSAVKRVKKMQDNTEIGENQ
ncbi:MAG: hypothetical protein R3B45_11845 [Bdellovibrionota bacterium]